MKLRRRTWIGLVLHLAVGLALALPSVGCSMMATTALRGALDGLDEREAWEAQAIERFVVTRGADGRVVAEVALRLADGSRRELVAQEDSSYGPQPIEGEIAAAAGGAYVRLGWDAFAPGAQVHAVQAGGAVAPEATPLDAAGRRDALLACVTHGRDGRFYVGIHPPPAGGRAADAPVGEAARWYRCSFTPPQTAGSRARQVALGIVGWPLAIAVDVVTWPIQAVMTIWIAVRTPVH